MDKYYGSLSTVMSGMWEITQLGQFLQMELFPCNGGQSAFISYLQFWLVSSNHRLQRKALGDDKRRSYSRQDGPAVSAPSAASLTRKMAMLAIEILPPDGTPSLFRHRSTSRSPTRWVALRWFCAETIWPTWCARTFPTNPSRLPPVLKVKTMPSLRMPASQSLCHISFWSLRV